MARTFALVAAATLAAAGASADVAEIRAMMLKLGSNTHAEPLWPDKKLDNQWDWEHTVSDELRLDEGVWREVTDRMAAKGFNMVVIGLAEGVVYPSHPELAVKGSWSVEKLKAELARLRGLGLEPIPKMNFAASHDTWLKEYHRMVSTPEYYRVCADVIREVWEIFDKPRLFHLGYDEETAGNQGYYSMAIVRQGELWWHDFLYLSGVVEKLGTRPWIWSDYCWNHPDEFLKRMPRSELQSNWYYGTAFMDEKDKHQLTRASSYALLEKGGFDQVPTGSNCYNQQNNGLTVPFCRKVVSPERLKGFMTAPWGETKEANVVKHFAAIDQLMAAK